MSRAASNGKPHFNRASYRCRSPSKGSVIPESKNPVMRVALDRVEPATPEPGDSPGDNVKLVG